MLSRPAQALALFRFAQKSGATSAAAYNKQLPAIEMRYTTPRQPIRD
jgi:hypothetical protein